MKTQTTAGETAEKKAHELFNKVAAWVNSSFNFIQVDVLNRCCDDNLFDYIRQSEITINDLAEFEGESGNKRWINAQMKKYPYIEDNPLYDTVMSSKESENYPMWNTCFEFRNYPGEMVQSAIKAGFGVIEGMEDFNTLLFVSGAGYSFYGAHWIPMYLDFYKDEAIIYEGIDYSGF